MPEQLDRISWIDQMRGMLILLVVLGHVVGSSYLTSCVSAQPIFAYLYRVIYFFHMPAFFIIAGLVWKNPSDGFLSFVRRKACRLLIPYYIFGAISIVIYFLLVGGFVADSSGFDRMGRWKMMMDRGSLSTSVLTLIWGSSVFGGNGFRCNSVLWFLPCLFSVLCWGYWIFKIERRWVWAICGGLSIFVYLFFEELWCWLPLQAGFAFKYVPFFLVGRFLKESGCFINKSVGVLSTFVFFVIYVFFVGVIDYDPWRSTRVIGYISSFCMAILGSVVVMAVAQRCHAKIFSFFGLYSIGIMLIHKFPLLFFQAKVPVVRVMMSMGVICSLSASMIVFSLTVCVCVPVVWCILKIMPVALGRSGK